MKILTLFQCQVFNYLTTQAFHSSFYIISIVIEFQIVMMYAKQVPSRSNYNILMRQYAL